MTPETETRHTPMVSIIVPVYKVEKYLNRCVDSILAQTYPSIEVLLVDDGSPDGCPRICDEYAARDARVQVIHKPNGGLSDARNAGIDAAHGEYIAFVDGDDYVDTGCMQHWFRHWSKAGTGWLSAGSPKSRMKGNWSERHRCSLLHA